MPNKKKKVREMRQASRLNPDGSRSSHLMSYSGDISKRRGDFKVFPTIAPKKGKETSTNPSDWVNQNQSQAAARGEVISVKSRRKAERLAAGSWKKGIDKKHAMKALRESQHKSIPMRNKSIDKLTKNK